MAVTTSLRSWKDWNAFERMLRLFPKIGVSVVFTIEFVVLVVHLTRFFRCYLCSCSHFPFELLIPRTSDEQPFFIRLYRTEFRSQHVESSVGFCFSTSRLAAFSRPLLLKLTWPRSHSLVTLLLIYSVTKKARMVLHDASSGTIVQGVFLLWHHCRTCDIAISPWLTPSLQNFASVLVRRSSVATQRTHLNDVTQHILPVPGTVHTNMVSYPSLGLDS